ncbi:DUF4253 domain-containing protein [Nocardiopsis suaedae]|uniref:DUF4253 domain-containing protein n=1 Tax=Nocardiopsis suaedae TaxID=3018444 RepID=A0ABT4TW77_9ACTN|nr:DUF4253 domain-containing protein [Nocardiopsis suaedae]MDA2808945.1 DUF4253 domain-containing protein [Nocardiopsis suaedae]
MHLPMPIPVLRTACAQRGCPLPQMDRVAVDVAGSPVYAARVPEKDVLALWSSLRALHDSSGWWPVLSGAPSATLTPWEMLDGSVDASALSLGNKHNPVCLLQDLYVRTFPDRSPGDEPVPSLVHDAADLAQRLTRLPEASGPPGADRDVLFEPEPSTPWAVASPTTLLMLVRACAGHEVPALLRWDGAGNRGIEGHEHMAVLRHFHEEYGAEMVGMTGDVIELVVDRAPTSPGGAALAAMEMYAYCPDIVLQGIGSADALAERVAPSGDWFLWWD